MRVEGEMTEQILNVEPPTAATLRKYGLTLKEVAQIIRRENLELPGGTIRTPSQEVLLRQMALDEDAELHACSSVAPQTCWRGRAS